MLRKIRYAGEAILLLFGFALFRLLPLDIASAFGGLLARLLGPLFRAHRTAENNLIHAMPELSPRERGRVLSKMWDNLGRVIGEYPHLSRPLMRQRITLEGREYLEQVKSMEKGVILVSGHFANWEIGPLTAALYGLPLVIIYRAANNPVADWLIRRIRKHYNTAMYNKGRGGATQSLKTLKEGQALGMLVDQKMNDGEALAFFGMNVMAATAGTQMAIKLQVPLLVARVVRTDGAYFHVSLEPPLFYDTSTNQRDAMQDIYRRFEQWIREYPAQWFWVHNRWDI